MKRDLVELISRFVEVDRDRIEVNFERQDRTLAMLANIPILGVNRPNGNGARSHAPVAPPPELAPEQPATPPNSTPRVRKRKRRKKSQRARTELPSTA
jgi:hypothetical protein